MVYSRLDAQTVDRELTFSVAVVVVKGRVTSFYGAELLKYTSFRAHGSGEGPVKQLLVHEKGVISLAPRSVHLAVRRGLAQWHITYVGRQDMAQPISLDWCLWMGVDGWM